MKWKRRSLKLKKEDEGLGGFDRMKEKSLDSELMPEYIKKLRKIRKGKYYRFKDVDDLRR